MKNFLKLLAPSSKAARLSISPITNVAISSALPWSNGCSESGFLLVILNPAMRTIEVKLSENVCTASATTATEL